MTRTNVNFTAGVQGSWLWDETNFHVDDVVDITYTDPYFVPSYTTPSIPDEELQVTSFYNRGVGRRKGPDGHLEN